MDGVKLFESEEDMLAWREYAKAIISSAPHYDVRDVVSKASEMLEEECLRRPFKFPTKE